MSYPESPQIPAGALEALAELRAAYHPVLGAGARYAVGIKQTAGAFTPQVALIVYLDKKKPRSELTPPEMVPPQFLGFATDVVEDRGTLIADHTPHNPLIGGIEISIEGDGVVDPGSGTLGAIVRDRLNGLPRLLTCGHVASTIGGSMYQPTHGRDGSAVIGTLLQSVFEPHTPPDRDWALIAPNGARGVEFAVKEVGAVRGTGQVQLWDAIKKRGRTTGLTTGVVVAIVPEFPGLATRQIECATFPFDGVFAARGDSGSVVLNAGDEVVGLLYRLSREVKDAQGNLVISTGMAYVIDAVLNDLQVDLAVTPAVSSVTPNTAAGAVLAFGKVVVGGWGFDPSSQVTFGGVPALGSNWVSATQIEATPPLGPVGPVAVRVSNKWGEWSSPGPGAQFQY